MNLKKSSFRKRIKSFVFAWEGVIAFFRSEHNAFIHLAVTSVAFATGIYLQITRNEFVVLIMVMAMVWTAEVFNTAIERSMDLISKEEHPKIKIIKDMAAAAVLISASAALIVGLTIFIPKLFH